VRLRFTQPSQEDLRAITLHFLDINVNAARSVARSIKSRCRRLIQFPYSGQVIDRDRYGDLRRLVAGHYIVVYRVEDRTVEILRVLHGARDIASLLDRGAEDPLDDS